MKQLGQRIRTWADLFALRDQPVHIVGAGSVEGAHLLLFLADHGFRRLVGHDFSPEPDFARAFKRVHVGWPAAERAAMLSRLLASTQLRFQDRYLEGIEDAVAIGVTQGWYLYDSNSKLRKSAALQSRFFSVVQLYLALAPGRVIGVSGSQGKSTTTRLLHDILKAEGRDVIHAGNDRHGQQALNLLESASRESLLLLEISNRHLKMLDRSPNVAVVTNVYPNHLDEHGGWAGYIRAKTRMVAYQRPGDVAVLNADLQTTREMAERTRAQVAWFGEDLAASEPGIRLDANRLLAQNLSQRFALDLSAIPLPGRHNAGNVAAAATAALMLDVAPASIERAVRAFHGLKHRLQFIWEAEGVRYYDDLNSTTPTASVVALRSLDRPLIWILGGDDKGLDNDELAAAARASVRTALALPGAGGERLATELRRHQVEVEPVADLRAAVRTAVGRARAGDAVLLSPACPGFFSRFYAGDDEDIGFRRLVREATIGSTSPPAGKPRKAGGPAR